MGRLHIVIRMEATDFLLLYIQIDAECTSWQVCLSITYVLTSGEKINKFWHIRCTAEAYANQMSQFDSWRAKDTQWLPMCYDAWVGLILLSISQIPCGQLSGSPVPDNIFSEQVIQTMTGSEKDNYITKGLETELFKKRLREIGVFIFEKTAGERAITLSKAQKCNLRESSDMFSVSPECGIQNISHKLK